MTVIVGLIADGGVYLGWDSAWVAGRNMDVSRGEKGFAVSLADGTPLGIGLAGNPRAGQVMRYGVDWSQVDAPERDGEPEWLVLTLIPAMRDALDSHGVPGDEDKPGTIDANMLVAIRGRLFGVYVHWQFREAMEPFDSVGTGGAEAVGALHALSLIGNDLTAGARIMRALATSERYNTDVVAPFTVVFVPATASACAPGREDRGSDACGRTPSPTVGRCEDATPT